MERPPSTLLEIRQRTLPVAKRLRLPLGGRIWRGQSGNWAGAETGSSIDFHDHRPYLPGDDPRHINWPAFARSGAYSMKLYREEVSPQIDLALDASASMFFEPAKHDRSWELLYFCRESCLQAGASVRTYSFHGDKIRELGHEELTAGTASPPRPPVAGTPSLALVPWRPNSLRIVISDWLFPPGNSVALSHLTRGHGRGIAFAVHSRSESDPDWEGHLSFLDCEGGTRQRRFVDADLMARYRRNYARHFGQWDDEARRHGILFARVPAEGTLIEAFQGEPIQRGAVESWA